MKKWIILLLVILLMMSAVSAVKVVDSDAGYVDQIYIPGYLTVYYEDGSSESFMDECVWWNPLSWF
tara:strand:- start:136 stop:333 length:198 start_codon:yes stop_codon:yes gene_type:complete